jgi:uncharacterized protein YbjQ (UPF0145 family)
MFFRKQPSPEEKQRILQEQQEAEASRQSLEQGGLPLKATKRLQEEVDKGHPLFTSDLSANELFLTRKQGYQPLSQVMGSSIYQVGWQYTRQYSWSLSMSELTVVSQAHQHAAQLALSRLQQEATLLKAHGVVGVRFARRDYEWGNNILEYTAIGTAVRFPDAPLTPTPFLSDLSGQEFWNLIQAGYYPAGVVTGYCSYYTALGSNIAGQLHNSWWGGVGAYNVEIEPFSKSLYTARHLAMTRATSMARNLNALGIVGMHIESNRQVIDYEQEREHQPTLYYTDLAVHFAVVGTAIIALGKDHVIPTPKATLTFTDLRPGRYGQNRELTFQE